MPLPLPGLSLATSKSPADVRGTIAVGTSSSSTSRARAMAMATMPLQPLLLGANSSSNSKGTTHMRDTLVMEAMVRLLHRLHLPLVTTMPTPGINKRPPHLLLPRAERPLLHRLLDPRLLLPRHLPDLRPHPHHLLQERSRLDGVFLSSGGTGGRPAMGAQAAWKDGNPQVAADSAFASWNIILLFRRQPQAFTLAGLSWLSWLRTSAGFRAQVRQRPQQRIPKIIKKGPRLFKLRGPGGQANRAISRVLLLISFRSRRIAFVFPVFLTGRCWSTVEASGWLQGLALSALTVRLDPSTSDMAHEQVPQLYPYSKSKAR